MSDHTTKPEEQEEGTSGNAFLDGVKILFGGAAHQLMKGLHFFDTVKSMVKTSGGSFAMASGTTELDVEFNTEAANLEAGGEAEARKLEAGGDAAERKATTSHQFTTNMPRGTVRRKTNRN